MASARILVVDDDPRFLHFVTELLTGAGYDVRSTPDPLLAVTLAEEFLPKLIILDLSMPGKDGLTLAQELQSNERTAKIPCMILSAHKAAEGSRPAKERGAVAYLEKPIQSSSLLWMIRALLEKTVV